MVCRNLFVNSNFIIPYLNYVVKIPQLFCLSSLESFVLSIVFTLFAIKEPPSPQTSMSSLISQKLPLPSPKVMLFYRCGVTWVILMSIYILQSIPKAFKISILTWTLSTLLSLRVFLIFKFIIFKFLRISNLSFCASLHWVDYETW